MCHPQQTESGMKSEYRLPHACRRDELYQDDSKHIRHRVITSAFQFQHRSEVMFQIHALRAQDVEHGSRVRRGHGSRQQHGRHQGHGNADIRESGNPINKESGEIVVSNTPKVESSMPCGNTGLISEYLVSIPLRTE